MGNPAVLFDAVLHPHRSLPPRGFHVLIAVLGTLSLVMGTAFILMGAWPVIGFFGLDVVLLYGAFRLSYRAQRQHERLRLTEDVLEVERVSIRGDRKRWRFQPYWLRVILEKPEEHELRVILTSHGRSLVIGSFMPPIERRRVAQELKGALDRLRAPIKTAAGERRGE
ncbi:MAG TPA: DUF2244 domain-containing protein [Stellaceae bacterium]|nr:DUF2244 domain-containing protein [Stellaceae bacterium]